MGRIYRWHVETICVFLVIAGIIVLHIAILPRTPTDAFQTTEASHAVYEGTLRSQGNTSSGHLYRGELCKTVNVWSQDQLQTNTRISVTGELNDNTLFAETVSKR